MNRPYHDEQHPRHRQHHVEKEQQEIAVVVLANARAPCVQAPVTQTEVEARLATCST